MEVKCDKCGHEWDYKGSMKTYATCPDCKAPTKIYKKEVQENENNNERGITQRNVESSKGRDYKAHPDW